MQKYIICNVFIINHYYSLQNDVKIININKYKEEDTQLAYESSIITYNMVSTLNIAFTIHNSNIRIQMMYILILCVRTYRLLQFHAAHKRQFLSLLWTLIEEEGNGRGTTYATKRREKYYVVRIDVFANWRLCAPYICTWKRLFGCFRPPHVEAIASTLNFSDCPIKSMHPRNMFFNVFI